MTASGTRVVFMGSPEFAVPSLQALVASGYAVVAVYTQPDRPAGRGNRLLPPEVKQAALRLGLPVLQPPSLRRTEALAELRALAPDLIVVAAFGQILRPAVLSVPPHGCLNVHASLLPRHRGASPVAAAILAGDAETGVSIMQMDAGLDTGPVIARRTTPIQDQDTTGSLTERLGIAGAGLLVETLPGWLAGSVPAEPQDDRLATYAPLLQKDAGRIDWSKPAVQIWREVRAYNPWPLSFTRLGDEPLQILEAAVVSAGSAEIEAAPGTVQPLSPEALPPAVRSRAGFAVATGGGLLAPLTVRRAGRNAVSGADFARGVRDLVGKRLGDPTP